MSAFSPTLCFFFFFQQMFLTLTLKKRPILLWLDGTMQLKQPIACFVCVYELLHPTVSGVSELCFSRSDHLQNDIQNQPLVAFFFIIISEKS